MDIARLIALFQPATLPDVLSKKQAIEAQAKKIWTHRLASPVFICLFYISASPNIMGNIIFVRQFGNCDLLGLVHHRMLLH